MPRLGNINQYEQKKAQQQPSAMPASMAPPQEATQGVPTTPVTPLSTEVRKESMGQAYTNEPQTSLARPMDVQKPVLQTMKPEEALESQRNNYMQSFDTWAEAEKRGDISQQDWANARIQKMIAEGKNPGDYENILSLYGEAETPVEKAKRERRERLGEVFSNLGNLIGNAANLYYTNKGGQYIDLNTANEKHRERMQRIKDKQDALAEKQRNIFINAKLGDIKTERAEKAALQKLKAEQAAKDKDNAFKLKLNAYLKELDNAHKLGQIDAQTKAKLAEIAAKAKTDKELEAFKQSNRIALKTTPSYGQNDIVESFADTNGVVWTRTKPFSKAEKAEFFESLPMEIQQMFTVEQYDDSGNVKSRRVDYDGALGYAINQGYITNPEERGFKKGKSSGKKTISGFGGENKKSNKKTISGF